MFNSAEEMELYKQQIQQRKAELTPPQIEKYMQNSWKTVAAKWADIKLEEDTINHNMADIDNENFIQYMKENFEKLNKEIKESTLSSTLESLPNPPEKTSSSLLFFQYSCSLVNDILW